jgi:tetratricopeptide (TPR) repeat protein
LALCEYAMIDLSTAAANAFYEAGFRQAINPRGTVLIHAEGSRLPFDVLPLLAVSYSLTPEGALAEPAALIKSLTESFSRLTQSQGKNLATDNLLHQLLENFSEVAHTKTDVFRERVHYSTSLKERLATARRQGHEAVRKLGEEILQSNVNEAGVLIDLMLSYRAVKAWPEMIALIQKMPQPLARTVMVQEQLGFALNRAGQSEEAERLLLKLIEQHGPSSETFSLLGRVYKDRWEQTLKSGKTELAHEVLGKAIDAYRRGFEADWRDAYPGINAVTLMELSEPPDPERERLIPVVTYAVERRIATGKPDYWDYATLIELAVLGKNEQKARAALKDALAQIREVWEPETTVRNLRLIRETRERRQKSVPWAKQVEEELERRAKS